MDVRLVQGYMLSQSIPSKMQFSYIAVTIRLCECEFKSGCFSVFLHNHVALHSTDSFFALYEEAKKICCAKRQSARKMVQERTYTEDELSDEDEYLCECAEC